MFKRSLILTAFVFLALTVCVQSAELSLLFYVLFPLLMFPLFYFWEESHRSFFLTCSACTAVIYTAYLIFHPSFEIILLGLGNLAFFAGIVFYKQQWKTALAQERELCDTAFKDLETLKQKHQSRLESLHHLEKQVAGLLDLFEIARDFNDSMSFQGMMTLLQQRVLPELPFKTLYLILVPQNQEVVIPSHFFSVTPQKVEEGQSLSLLPAPQRELMEKVGVSKKLLREEAGLLAFPLIADGEMTACLILEGTQPDDLAKFEVLAAYMTLQVKKVYLYETVKDLSIRDGLTGVFVRRHFLARFEEELKRSIKYSLPLAVLMVDIDHFKRYNDQYGHLAGDSTLKQVADILCQSLRKVDIVARYGGEEFVVVIPETKGGVAHEVAERIRSSIARYNFKVYNDQTRVTVSIGISAFPENIPTRDQNKDSSVLIKQLIQMADQALYRAKEEGRNRVVGYQSRS